MRIAHLPTWTDDGSVTATPLLQLPRVNPKDLSLVEDEPGRKVWTALNVPSDSPLSVRLTQTDVKNVYSGTDVDPTVFLPSRQGTKVFAEVRAIIDVTDDNDRAYKAPIRVAVAIDVPKDQAFDDETVLSVLKLGVAATFKKVANPVGEAAIAGYTRGALYR